MSQRRRTLSLVTIFLSLNHGFVSSQVLPGMYPNFMGSRAVPQVGNPLPVPNGNLISAAQRLLPNSQRPILNEGVTESFATESPIVGCPQECVNSVPSLSIPSTQIPCNIPAPAVSSPEFISIEALPIQSNYPSLAEYSGFIDQNTIPAMEYSRFIDQNIIPAEEYPGFIDQNTIPLGPLPQTNPFSETVYSSSFTPNPELAQFYQTNVNVQIPTIPAISPFIALATPIPGLLPQNYPTEAYTNYGPVFNPEPNVVEVPTIVETAPVALPPNIGTNIVDSTPNSQLPMTFQINMPSPSSEQPIILISSPAPAPVLQDTSYTPSIPPIVPPPLPMIINQRSRSSWRSWLPILLIAMCDCGCQNSGSNCYPCSTNIPVPYPIPIPTNNPIVLGGRKGKAKTSSAADAN